MRSTLAVPDSQWYLLRLANMSTLLREWIALHLTQTLACTDSILGQPVRPAYLSQCIRDPFVSVPSIIGKQRATVGDSTVPRPLVQYAAAEAGVHAGAQRMILWRIV